MGESIGGAIERTVAGRNYTCWPLIWPNYSRSTLELSRVWGFRDFVTEGEHLCMS